MTAPRTFRSLALATAAVCVCLLALPGCGGSPSSAPAKKEEPKVPPPGPDPKGTDPKGTDPKGTPIPPQPVLPALGPVEKAADDAVTAFLRDVGQGSARADQLSTRLLKVVGQPVVFDGDKALGYSATEAATWLNRLGKGQTFGPELDRKQAGDLVYVRGSFNGKPGGYSLRLVKEGGAWKVDLIVFSSAEWKGAATTGSSDAAFLEFAATAFVEGMADSNLVPDPTVRGTMLATAMTPELRAAWGGAAERALKAVQMGGGTQTFTLTRAGGTDAAPEFKVELTKPAGKRTFVVKLTKHENTWLVSDVSEQKG